MQSLLPIPVAIVLLYINSFKPSSVEEMENCCALIKHTSTYCLNADNKDIAWFDIIDKDLLPVNISTYRCENTKESSLISACWIDKYALIPSCNGTLMTIQDSTQYERLYKLNGRIRTMIKDRIALLKEHIELLKKKKDDIEYYLSIHNVNDEGYNIIANYHDTLKNELSDAKTTLKTLGNAISAKRLSIIKKESFTLLRTDKTGKNKSTTCRVITKRRTTPFCLIQTEDKKTPEGARSIHFSQFISPALNDGEKIIYITQPLCVLNKQLSGDIHSLANIGTIKNKHISDMPLEAIPDASLVFTSEGRPLGIIFKGEILSSCVFGTNYKTLIR